MSTETPLVMETASSPSAPSGIGGWLILPIIGFGLTIIRIAGKFLTAHWDNYGAVLSATTQPLVTLRVPFALAFISEWLLVTCAACCLYLILSKQPRNVVVRFTTLFYLLLVGESIFIIWNVIATEHVTDKLSPSVGRAAAINLVSSITAAGIWIPYFFTSERVNNTFRS
jgi:hypothetical protein